MAKQTLEAVLKARRHDPRAMRGALMMVAGKPRIVFGRVGDLPRVSFDISGNKISVCDDPRADGEAEEKPAEEAPVAEDGKPAPKKPAKKAEIK